MDSPAPLPPSPAADPADAPGFAERVKTGIIWRSGSQIVGQLIAWTATFLVIRLLDPADYGLVAMTGVVLTFLDLFKGWGFASALVREEQAAELNDHMIRVMTTPPHWAADMPLAAEGRPKERYG